MEDRLFDPTPTLSVGEVLSRARVVVEKAFKDEVWVEGEIQSLRRTQSNVYFDLVDGGSRLPVVLFEKHRRGVNVLMRRAGLGDRMDDGLAVRIRGSVSVYDRTGSVQLQMRAIDPKYTLGALALERDRVLQALSAEGLLAANGRLPVVGPPLRVALITSRGSAAAEDFLHELTASGLGFAVRVHDVRVQGREAEPTIVRALAGIERSSTDVV
ncbi:MAG TPA: exodeoxyribonuclease VII large subunit, partial [Acidimicrobiales bacterium]|nr:exodeoxyribonuclease VII large subunit [Acidimicrobiales bacterium]